MLNAEQSVNQVVALSWLDKLARSILLNVLSKLPEGELRLKEKGLLVDVFGHKDTDLRAEVNILDMRAYRHLLFGGSCASGETYTEGMWDTPNLTNVIRIFARNLPMLDEWENKLQWLAMPLRKLVNLSRHNSKRQAKKNISAHYDLGNKLYRRFLDSSMMYSAAIYPDAETSLADAQQYKLKLICEKLQLGPQDHLLEIGSGWGGLAIYAAKHYGCRVTTTTISEQQYAHAAEQIHQQGLDNQISLLKKDYRLLEGQYDKLVSIEMIEAVGKDYLPEFFKRCDKLLSPHGLMLLQSITIDDRRYDSYSNNLDFIQKHIFPGGFLPSQLEINRHLKSCTDMMICDLHDIGLDYAKTLQDWQSKFIKNQQALNADGYDERFIRLWRYYFSYCEGGFLERTISTVQLLLSKPGFRAATVRA